MYKKVRTMGKSQFRIRRNLLWLTWTTFFINAINSRTITWVLLKISQVKLFNLDNFSKDASVTFLQPPTSRAIKWGQNFDICSITSSFTAEQFDICKKLIWDVWENKSARPVKSV